MEEASVGIVVSLLVSEIRTEGRKSVATKTLWTSSRNGF